MVALREASIQKWLGAYNEQYLVYASLERLKILAESPLLERIEVIAVDDGSTGQTPSVLLEFEHSINERRPKLSCRRLRGNEKETECVQEDMRRQLDRHDVAHTCKG